MPSVDIEVCRTETVVISQNLTHFEVGFTLKEVAKTGSGIHMFSSVNQLMNELLWPVLLEHFSQTSQE